MALPPIGARTFQDQVTEFHKDGFGFSCMNQIEGMQFDKPPLGAGVTPASGVLSKIIEFSGLIPIVALAEQDPPAKALVDRYLFKQYVKMKAISEPSASAVSELCESSNSVPVFALAEEGAEEKALLTGDRAREYMKSRAVLEGEPLEDGFLMSSLCATEAADKIERRVLGYSLKGVRVEDIKKEQRNAIVNFLAENAISSFDEVRAILPQLNLEGRAISFVNAYNPGHSVAVSRDADNLFPSDTILVLDPTPVKPVKVQGGFFDGLLVRLNSFQFTREFNDDNNQYQVNCRFPYPDDVVDFVQKELSEASSNVEKFLQKLMPELKDLWGDDVQSSFERAVHALVVKFINNGLDSSLYDLQSASHYLSLVQSDKMWEYFPKLKNIYKPIMQNPKVRIIIREFFNKVSSDDFIKQDVSTIPMRFNELLELQCRKVPPKIFEEITASANSSMLFFREIHNYLFESPRVESKRPEQPLGSGDAAAWFAPVFQAGGARPFQVQALAQPQASGLTTQQKATLLAVGVVLFAFCVSNPRSFF